MPRSEGETSESILSLPSVTLLRRAKASPVASSIGFKNNAQLRPRLAVRRRSKRHRHRRLQNREISISSGRTEDLQLLRCRCPTSAFSRRGGRRRRCCVSVLGGRRTPAEPHHWILESFCFRFNLARGRNGGDVSGRRAGQDARTRGPRRARRRTGSRPVLRLHRRYDGVHKCFCICYDRESAAGWRCWPLHLFVDVAVPRAR